MTDLRDELARVIAGQTTERWESAKKSRIIGIQYGLVDQSYEAADRVIAAGLAVTENAAV